MTRWRLIWQSLKWYWRPHLAVVAGVALAAMVLTGSLLVGDSVRATLHQQALDRIGSLDAAIVSSDRLVHRDLLGEDDQIIPALMLQGSVSLPDGSARVNNVNILGITPADLARLYEKSDSAWTSGLAINTDLAARLDLAPSDRIVIRIAAPDAMPGDVPLSSDLNRIRGINRPIATILPPDSGGRFSMHSRAEPALNVFLPLDELQALLDQPDRINLGLLPVTMGIHKGSSFLTRRLTENWRITHAGYRWEEIDENTVQLTTERVFLDRTRDTTFDRNPNARLPQWTDMFYKTGVHNGRKHYLTYLANLITHDQRSTPYSFVTATDDRDLIPAEVPSDGIVINRWLADDLGAEVGDEIELRYFKMGEGRALVENQASFTVVRIVEIEGAYADRKLTPEFPDIPKEGETLSEWEPSFELKYEIRDKDDAYWREYRTVPKAFISLNAGQRLWGNRYGELTAVRLEDQIDDQINHRKRVGNRFYSPSDLGIVVQPVRERALAGAGGTTDFGGLFIGFSMFLIVAAVVLTALLFVLGVQRRADQIGMLAAVGWPTRNIRSVLLAEGAILAIIGGLIGTAAGAGYTALVLAGMNTIWSEAISGMQLQLGISPVSLMIGFLGSVAVAMSAIAWSVWRESRVAIRASITGGGQAIGSNQRSRSLIVGIVLGVIGLLGAGVMMVSGEPDPGLFFGVGALLLLAGICLVHAWVQRGGGWRKNSETHFTLSQLAVRGVGRRSGRSVATVGLIAAGCFLVVAVSASRQDPTAHLDQPGSGSGGFALFAETSVPLLRDLGQSHGYAHHGLLDADMQGVEVMPIRVKAGDDASCLNLNRAQSPTLLGVDADRLAKRGAFTFVDHAELKSGTRSAWERLNELYWNTYRGRKKAPSLNTGYAWIDRVFEPLNQWINGETTIKTLYYPSYYPHTIIPVIGDVQTVYWGLGLSVGDHIEVTDDRGETLELVIVGTIQNSILQGSLIMSEAHFQRHFPDSAGYGQLLIDVPADRVDEFAELLSEKLADHGLAVETTGARMQRFAMVEQTYLSIFQIIGGLGLLLGSVGLAVIVFRNVLERRAELGIMRAVGFSRQLVVRMVFREHAVLLAAGLGLGLVAALIAVLPVLMQHPGGVPWGSLAVQLLIIFGIGLIVTRLAAGSAVRGDVLEALRRE